MPKQVKVLSPAKTVLAVPARLSTDECVAAVLPQPPKGLKGDEA